MTEPLRLEVAADFTPLLRFLDDAQRRQLPFATAVALTNLAKDARALVAGGLRDRFTIRSSWVERGIRYKPAEKRDWPHTSALVYSKDAFMQAQEVGGVKRGRAGGDTPQPLAIRRTKEERTTPSKWPGAQLKRPRTFVRRLTSGPAKGERAVLRRASADRYPLQVLYVFAPSTRIRPRLGMRKTVTDSVGAGYAKAFETSLQRALAPRVPRGPSS